ncbi:hypothetical protein PGQ11_011234 [Apiospora arundinis]|uniref:Uncharacterized protein n=1 Tax=Apiospora arundinis TaxID=335852 RepID=A0ABR2HZ08_9PEZI
MLCKFKAATTAIHRSAPHLAGPQPLTRSSASLIVVLLKGRVGRIARLHGSPQLEPQRAPTGLMLGKMHDTHGYSLSYDDITLQHDHAL